MKVISDIMLQWYDMFNTFIITINFYNAKIMNCALIFIISNHNGRKGLRNLLPLEPCNDMFKMISDKIAHLFDILNTSISTINFYNAKKMNCATMFIISNHYGRKGLSNLL